MASQKTHDMTTGNPLRIILMFSIPILIGNVFQQLYSMVDTVIVGQCLGEDALAAVGLTGSLVFLVLGFANGIGQGFGVMVSQAFGAKDYKRVKHYVALSLMLTVIVSVILTVPAVAWSKTFLTWMKAPSNVIDLSDAYIKVIFAGIILNMGYNVASGILRGIGDSKTPLYFLIFSSLLNIGLDFLLILVIPLGVAGAAYATIISQGLSALLCYIYMFKRFEVLKLSREDFYFDLAGVNHLLAIGIPMALNYSITAVGCIMFQTAVNKFDSTVVAAYTAASKVHCIAYQPMPTLGTALATYCGQNLGAGRYDRIFKGMRVGFFLSFVTAAFGAFINCVCGRFLISLFLDEPNAKIYSYGMQYLYIVSIYLIPLAWIFVYRNALQGLNRGIVPMISGLVELIARFLTITFCAKPFGYAGVCYADPAAWVSTGLLLIVTYLIWKARTKKMHT